jgi:alpha-beta hydrolase superfamily lysophospholipase
MHYRKNFYTSDKVLIKYDAFKNDQSSNKILIYIHGFAGTVPQIIRPFYKKLNKEKIDFYIPYQRYTSWSNQTEGHINSSDEILFDLKEFILFISKEEPNKKIYLLGHSIGANLVLNLLPSLGDLIEKVIIINPSQKTKPDINLILFFTYIFYGFLNSQKTIFHMFSDPRLKKGEKDKAEARLREKSKHITKYFSYTFLKELKKITKETNQIISTLKKPALFIISQRDETVRSKGGLSLYHKYLGKKKLVRPDAGHGTYVMNLTKNEIIDFILSEKI